MSFHAQLKGEHGWTVALSQVPQAVRRDRQDKDRQRDNAHPGMTISEKIKQAIAAEVEKNKQDIETKDFSWFQFRVIFDPSNPSKLIKVITQSESITDLRTRNAG